MTVIFQSNHRINEIQTFIQEVSEGNHLSIADAGRTFQIIMSGGATPAQIAAILMGLKRNGETVEEISGAVKALRTKATKFPVPEEIRVKLVDTCGTGGDKKGSYNISTTVAFVVAAAGVPVAKHGNKAISSRSGSSDILTSLGVNIDADAEISLRALEEIGICFLMAPRYHTAMRHVGSVRQEMSIRTIFNVLGPLINPARPQRQIMGVYDKNLVVPIANVLKELGTKHAWVVHGLDGMDEITIMDDTFVAEIKDNEIRTFTITPADYGIEIPEDEDALKGGDSKTNSIELKKVLGGEEGAYRDIVLINAGAALVVGGKASNLKEGIQLATEIIDSGKAFRLVAKLVEITNMN